MDTLGRIRSYMQARDWSEYRLAKESGLSQSTITNMFNRRTAPSVPTLEAICSGFGITLSQFFSGSDSLVELSEEQMEMFEKWSALTKRQKQLVSELIDNMK